jgi:hypothetical protein
MFQTTVVENITSHVSSSLTFFSKIVPFVNNLTNKVQPDKLKVAFGASALYAEYLRLQTDTQNM